MKAKNEMRISFPSNSNNEAFGRAVVAAFAAQLDPTIDELSDIKTAVSEAVTNCIVHAYRDTIGMIYITAKYDDHGTLQIKFCAGSLFSWSEAKSTPKYLLNITVGAATE